MSNPTSFVPISALDLYPDPVSPGFWLLISAAGVSYKIDARQLVLPSDALVTWSNFKTQLPGSKRLTAGAGVSISFTADQAILAATTSGQLVVFDQRESANLSGTQQNWNPGLWNGGLGKNRLEITPLSAGAVVGGLSSSGMVEGQVVVVLNNSDTDMVKLSNNNGGSTSANQFRCPGSSDFNIVPRQGIQLMYEFGLGWRFI